MFLFLLRNKRLLLLNQPVGQALTILLWERKIQGSNLKSVKSNTVLPVTCHRCDTSSKEASSGAMTRRWAPQTRSTFKCITVSLTKKKQPVTEQPFRNATVAVICHMQKIMATLQKIFFAEHRRYLTIYCALP